MQNRYFGDVGDFGKYGLLRQLCGLASDEPKLSLGIVWYLAPDEVHNDDGKHVSYLEKPEYRRCDPELFDGLKLLLSDGNRTVSKIQQSDLLPCGTTFFDKVLTYDGIRISGSNGKQARLQKRKGWVTDAYGSVKDRDLVFLDPDNGFEVKSVPRHADKGVKYLFWDEAEQFADGDRTLVIYHHLNRTMSSKNQVAIKLKEFQTKLPRADAVIPMLFKRGSHRVFFVLPSKAHSSLISDRLQGMVNSPWQTHTEILA